MKYCSLFFFSSLLALTACSRQPDKSALAVEIEQKFSKANPDKDLRRFARYYVLYDNSVRATYIVEEEGARQRIAEECARQRFNTFPCNDKDFGYVESGHSRWFDNDENFPIATDAGCGLIYIEYDFRSGKFDKVECESTF
jgi:hypothetical protein